MDQPMVHRLYVDMKMGGMSRFLDRCMDHMMVR